MTPALLASCAELVDRTILRMRAAGVSDRNIALLLGSAARALREDQTAKKANRV